MGQTLEQGDIAFKGREPTSQTFGFAWWNTGLSPQSKQRSSPREQEIAHTIVEAMVGDMGISFLALGEVCDADIEAFRSFLDPSGFEVRSGLSKVGRSRFDTCFILRRDSVVILNTKDIVTTIGNSTLRVAQRLDLEIGASQFPVHIFVSHWPSRLWCQQNHPNRHTLALRLRDSLEALYKKYASVPYVILLGDYNDEPFDQPLSEHLLATRDRTLVEHRDHLLYNPFWRTLGSTTNHDKDDSNFGGSYYHRGGDKTRWRVFDQIIFSSTFLNGDEWILDEEGTRLLKIPGYYNLITDTHTPFDHIPVIGVIRRVVT